MKRERSDQFDSITTMAKCLMLLSRGGELDHMPHASATNFNSSVDNSSTNININRVFECKTCNRQFPSFQALGGHRASHKKPRLMGGDGGVDQTLSLGGSQVKPKTHECSICGLEFAIGQALGGHMRRHRAAALNENNTMKSITHMSTSGSSDLSSDHSQAQSPPEVKKQLLCLDLNLTPLENDMKILKVRKIAPPLVDCFF